MLFAELDAHKAVPPAQWEKLDPKHRADLERDVERGAKISAEADKQLKPTEKSEYEARVQKIVDELAVIANRQPAKVLWGDARLNPFNYKVKVVQGEDVNAFSIPGGYLYVYEGLVDFAESDHELAGVLAHEIAHAAFRHVPTLEREQKGFQNISLPLIIAIALGLGPQAGGTVANLGSLINQSQFSGWSQKAEESADYGGFQYLIQSGYNPVGLVTFMERLAVEDRNRPHIEWGIYRTHPPSKERADHLSEHLREAGIPIRRSQVTTSYASHVDLLEDQSARLRFGKREIYVFHGKDAEARAQEAGQRLNDFCDQVPDLVRLSVRSDGQVLGDGKLIFQIQESDAVAQSRSLSELRTATDKALKASLYSLAYRVWDQP